MEKRKPLLPGGGLAEAPPLPPLCFDVEVRVRKQHTQTLAVKSEPTGAACRTPTSPRRRIHPLPPQRRMSRQTTLPFAIGQKPPAAPPPASGESSGRSDLPVRSNEVGPLSSSYLAMHLGKKKTRSGNLKTCSFQGRATRQTQNSFLEHEPWRGVWWDCGLLS